MINIVSSLDTVTRIKELLNNLRYLDSLPNNSPLEVNKIEFVTPLSITPLSIIITNKQLIYNYSANNSGYFQTINFPTGTDDISVEVSGKTYMPIIHLALDKIPKTERQVKLGVVHSTFLSMIRTNVIGDQKFVELITDNTLGFLVGETIDNVEEHSNADNLFLFTQYWFQK